MPYKLIKGEFHIFYPDRPRQGPEPDGDTLKFLPANPQLVEQLHRENPGTASPDFNDRGMINLRFEGIDALETHFKGAHQDLTWAIAARDAVLQKSGFENVQFWDDLPNKVKAVQPHPLPGYILANTLDSHGRIIAFVYSGTSSLMDGSEVWLDVPTLEASMNAQLLAEGLVYPAFYTTLPIELKDKLAALTVQAREKGLGLWQSATATLESPATIAELATLKTLVIWPKLFRRLVSYFAGGYSNLSQFVTWLRADPRDRDDRVLLPNRELGNMHDLIRIEGDRLSMLYSPEDVIILPDNASGGTPPVPSPQPREAGQVRIVAALVNPIGTDKDKEVVTLLNLSPQSVSLEGWAIKDREAKQGELLTGTLEPGEVRQVRLSSQVQLGNRGDTITLVDESGHIIDQVSYKAEQAAREGWTLVF
jgi:endonuclease YncB( thermonuclease family)